MKVSDFNYELPEQLIAQFPTQERAASGMLVVSEDSFADRQVRDMADFLLPGDLLVLNNTQVIPARLYGQKDTGGRVEILLERIIGDQQFLAQIRASRAPKVGQFLAVDGDHEVRLKMLGRENDFFILEVEGEVELLEWFEQVGHIPLPPYIDRADQNQDSDRYQTVYAQARGAVAAPTAGLHYDQELLETLKAKGVQIKMVTLHVGAGTYQPVKVDDIKSHSMHSEWIDVDQSVCDAIIGTKQAGNRVVAVGTTVVRSLETAAQNAKQALIEPFQGETDIFIYPGFEFQIVDLLQTNFHLPQSTLLMLVSAFAGQENIQKAYQYAIDKEYRFFSYGDSMLLERV